MTTRKVAPRFETEPASLSTLVRHEQELFVVLDSIAAMVPRHSAQQGKVVELLLDYAKQLHAFPGAAHLALRTPPTGPAYLDLLETATEILVREGLSVASAECACDALFLLVTASLAQQEARTGDDAACSIPDLHERAVAADSANRPDLPARNGIGGETGRQRLEWSLRAVIAGAKHSSEPSGPPSRRSDRPASNGDSR